MVVKLNSNVVDRTDLNIESAYAKPGRPLRPGVGMHGAASHDYSYRAVARLSKRGQEETWPATAQ